MLCLCTHEILGRSIQERIPGAIGGERASYLGGSLSCYGNAKSVSKKAADEGC
jgi:hypothetical protein